jgi:hypothetical protein
MDARGVSNSSSGQVEVEVEVEAEASGAAPHDHAAAAAAASGAGCGWVIPQKEAGYGGSGGEAGCGGGGEQMVSSRSLEPLVASLHNELQQARATPHRLATQTFMSTDRQRTCACTRCMLTVDML